MGAGCCTVPGWSNKERVPLERCLRSRSTTLVTAVSRKSNPIQTSNRHARIFNGDTDLLALTLYEDIIKMAFLFLSCVACYMAGIREILGFQLPWK